MNHDRLAKLRTMPPFSFMRGGTRWVGHASPHAYVAFPSRARMMVNAISPRWTAVRSGELDAAALRAVHNVSVRALKLAAGRADYSASGVRRTVSCLGGELDAVILANALGCVPLRGTCSVSIFAFNADHFDKALTPRARAFRVDGDGWAIVVAGVVSYRTLGQLPVLNLDACVATRRKAVA